VRRISTGTPVAGAGTGGWNSAAAHVPSTAITDSLVERRAADSPAVFGTPLPTSHWVNLTMPINAVGRDDDPGTKARGLAALESRGLQRMARAGVPFPVCRVDPAEVASEHFERDALGFDLARSAIAKTP
jgi:hypothetical protein